MYFHVQTVAVLYLFVSVEDVLEEGVWEAGVLGEGVLEEGPSVEDEEGARAGWAQQIADEAVLRYVARTLDLTQLSKAAHSWLRRLRISR